VLRVSDQPVLLTSRPRRLRRTAALRALVQETALRPERFVFPMFVRSGRGVREPIPSLPGHGRLSVDEAAAFMEISPATVKRQWSFARAWLSRALVTPREQEPGSLIGA